MTASDIPEEDLQIEAWSSRLPGGQQVGLTRIGVKITHLPSGLVAHCEVERSQHKNRAIAMDMILGGLTSPHYRGHG